MRTRSPTLCLENELMKPLVVAYKPLPDDVTAQLREHVELVQVDGAEALTEALTKAEVRSVRA